MRRKMHHMTYAHQTGAVWRPVDGWIKAKNGRGNPAHTTVNIRA
jgi:hypothetical protein